MFYNTKIYTVHINPNATHPQEEAVFVREGFNIFAFLFTSVWALYHRLWGAMVMTAALQFVIMTASKNHVLSEPSAAFMVLGIQLVTGFHGNDWIRARLKQQGYVFADIAAADNTLRAQQRFFDRHAELL